MKWVAMGEVGNVSWNILRGVWVVCLSTEKRPEKNYESIPGSLYGDIRRYKVVWSYMELYEVGRRLGRGLETVVARTFTRIFHLLSEFRGFVG